jgi:ectoine hydroxylase-related dioxygenase (phytanoyl-CoA dioxygenase family)
MNETDSGYSISERVFDRQEMNRVLESLNLAQIPHGKAGARHVLRVAAVRELAGDDRLVNIARKFVGSHPIPFRATLFHKSPSSNWLVTWHQDTALPLRQRVNHASWGPWSVKSGVLHAMAPAAALAAVVALRVHLDDSTQANGPLRVLPGTHKGGVLAHHDIQRLAETVMPVECVAPAGGVVAVRPLVVHASSKVTGGPSRRVLHIEYAATVHLEPGIELAVGSHPNGADAPNGLCDHVPAARGSFGTLAGQILRKCPQLRLQETPQGGESR